MGFWILFAIVVVLGYRYYRRGKDLEKSRAAVASLDSKLSALQVEINLRYGFAEESAAKLKESQAAIEELEEQLRRTVHQKKSSEVRTGQIAEQMAPFLDGFPFDPKKVVFLGKPIDFVAFDDEGVHFLEVKSGKSQLTSSQRRIRNQIEEGKVSFEIYRIKGE